MATQTYGLRPGRVNSYAGGKKMPLKPGKSRKALGENIRELRKTGRKPKQAIAIAFSVRDRPKKGKGRGKCP